MQSKLSRAGRSALCARMRTEEVVWQVVLLSKTRQCLFPPISSIKIEIQAGRESAVEFSTGPEPMVYKAKNGHLMVVRWPLLTVQHVLLCYDSVCSLCATGYCRRFPLEPGHANMCGVKRTHKKPLHISSGDPRGEITVSTGNTSSVKSAWTFVVQPPGFHHCMLLKKKKNRF